MSGELVRVAFHGDTLDAIKDERGVWVSGKRVCESLGIDWHSQRQKLKEKAWAVEVLITSTGLDGKQYEMQMLSLDTLPMWLATIEPKRVAESVRAKLELYQKQAAGVLADYFLGRKQADGTLSAVQLKQVVQLVVEAMRAEQPTPVLAYPQPAGPIVTVADRIRFKGWLTATASQRSQVRSMANAMLFKRNIESPDLLGGHYVYRAHQLAILDDAIDIVWQRAKDAEKAKGGLYAEVQPDILPMNKRV